VLKERRQQEILAELERAGSFSVADLSQSLGVSA
jgi:DeoR/GlpR family transcriptional regulator of sugar metabolism